MLQMNDGWPDMCILNTQHAPVRLFSPMLMA